MVYQQTDGCFKLEPQTTQRETIVSLASSIGRGSIGVIRVSGPHVTHLLGLLTSSKKKESSERKFTPRQAFLQQVKDESGETIDQAIFIYFQAPFSFTGEDVLEIQAHGGKTVMQMVVNRVLQLGQNLFPPIRLAEPGEFSKRAFLNGKLDLAQAEAVAALIEANNESAVRAAARSLQGDFSRDIHFAQDQLNFIRVFVESSLDFPDEDIEFLESAHIQQKVESLKEHLVYILSKAKQGKLLQEGIRLAIVGLPNTGKSSLLNTLSQSDRAIVSPIPGTTRDKIEENILIHDIPIQLIDTAGLRQTEDLVEKLGIERTWIELQNADIILLVSDLSRFKQEDYIFEERNFFSKIENHIAAQKIIHVLNKVDLNSEQQYPNIIKQTHTCFISTKTGQGVETLKSQIAQLAGKETTQEGVYLARERHIQALLAAQTHLHTAESILSMQPMQIELLAEELTLTQQQLDTILGEQTADDLLGKIFSSFCIGK